MYSIPRYLLVGNTVLSKILNNDLLRNSKDGYNLGILIINIYMQYNKVCREERKCSVINILYGDCAY